MTDEEREKLIKEIRLVVMHDITMVLAKMSDNSSDDELKRTAKHLLHYVGERASEISQDTADRPRI